MKGPLIHEIKKYHHQALKSSSLTKARKARPLASCLGLSRASSLSAHVSNEANERQSADSRGTPIYFNDHLTHENKVLYSKSLALKRQPKWSFLWTDNSTISKHGNAGNAGLSHFMR